MRHPRTDIQMDLPVAEPDPPDGRIVQTDRLAPVVDDDGKAGERGQLDLTQELERCFTPNRHPPVPVRRHGQSKTVPTVSNRYAGTGLSSRVGLRFDWVSNRRVVTA